MLLGVVALGAFARAQDIIPGVEQDPTKEQRLLPPNPFRSLLERGDVPTTFDGGNPNSLFRGWQPITPPDFGAYPGGAFASPYSLPGQTGPVTLPIQPRSPNRWPGWMHRDDDGFLPSLAILGFPSDFVWVREAEESVFIPLAEDRKFLIVKEGTEIDVRGAGQYAIRLHGGADVRVAGVSHVTLAKLDEKGATLDCSTLTRLFLLASTAPVRIQFGPQLAIEAAECRLRFERDEDGALTCWHEIGGDATVVLRGERTALTRGHRVRLMTEAGHTGIALELGSDGDVKLSQDGRVLNAHGTLRGGSVVWNGSRIKVPGGGVLRIDPLLGKEFPASPSHLP
ncbi:MAG: hypothetical protein U1F36_07820 [Planctomycetota bacterium]